MTTEIIKTAKKVIETEITGLTNLKNSLGESFTQAVDLIAGSDGRVVVSGMGKSGHIGNKIAATLASTGTPSFFVHPSEASHGDLGMITPKDIVLALSNSGKTAELFNLISYCKRFSIPIIAITKDESSELGRNASICLALPVFEEACPMGLAPTTSTTIQLTLGDALAVSLLEKQGFTADDFGVYHPGGALGSRLMRVAEIMHTTSPFVRKEDSLKTVLLTITSGSLGCVAVVDEENNILGVITDGDLRRHMGDDLQAQTAADLMSSHPITVSPSMLITEAIAIMNKKHITALLVAEDNQLKGVIHIHDLLRAGVK
ncbi:MAG: SIS domain-containing protein [Alphaproteobacteria bacterium]